MKSNTRYRLLIAGGAALSLLGMIAAVCLGVINFTPAQAARVVIHKLAPSYLAADEAPTLLEINMIWGLRIPRVLLGFIVGAGLAVCGACMQTLVKNKLADPYVLGVSSSAAAMACGCMLLGVTARLGEFGLQLSSFAGALLGSLFVCQMARGEGHSGATAMLLTGVILSMIMSAATSLMTVTSPDIYAMRGITFWITGSLTGAKWEYLSVPAACVMACLFYLMARHRGLDAIAFGNETARTLGINATGLEKGLFAATALLTGICVSVAGSIGFVGMIVPHIVRRFTGARHRRVLPAAALLGGNLVVWADVAARLVVAPDEIPVGIMTALLGTPVFLVILRRGREEG